MHLTNDNNDYLNLIKLNCFIDLDFFLFDLKKVSNIFWNILNVRLYAYWEK